MKVVVWRHYYGNLCNTDIHVKHQEYAIDIKLAVSVVLTFHKLAGARCSKLHVN